MIPLGGICSASGAVVRMWIKINWHDGLGACPFTRRLERGRFIWPNVEGHLL